MRHQRRSFVVEVKRGGNRAAFKSLGDEQPQFSHAETLLFGRTSEVETDQRHTAPTKPAGRILFALDEPETPPAAVETADPPRRRGRKPSSDRADRKAVRTPAADIMRERRATATERVVERAPVTAVPAEPRPAAETAAVRPRLRDRSKILKRYVLGTEPRPGEFGSIRARRAAKR